MERNEIKFTRQMASVRGVGDLGTRVVATDDLASVRWQKVKRRALIPILEAGVDEVELNGVAAPSGLNGLCGWYEWNKMPVGTNTFAANDKTATLISFPDGMYLILR